MGISHTAFTNRIKALGLNVGKKACGRRKTWSSSEKAEEFWKWWNIDIADETDLKKSKVEMQNLGNDCYDSISNTMNSSHISYYDNYEPLFNLKTSYSIPENGSLMFECNADEALNTLKAILCNSKVHLDVSWDIIKED